MSKDIIITIMSCSILMIYLIIKANKTSRKKYKSKKITKTQAKKIARNVSKKRAKRYEKINYVDKKSAYIQACWDEVKKENGMKK